MSKSPKGILISALEAHGYTVMPAEPTKEMLDRAMSKIDHMGNENYVSREDLIEAYREMVTARPT